MLLHIDINDLHPTISRKKGGGHIVGLRSKNRGESFSYLEPPAAALNLIGALGQPGGGDLATVRPRHVAVTHLPVQNSVL